MKPYTTILTADQMATAIKSEEARLWERCKDLAETDARYHEKVGEWNVVAELAKRLWIEPAKEEAAS